MKKLFEIKKNSIIECRLSNQKGGTSPGEIRFDHIDGAYSYCEILKPKRYAGEIVHLHATTQLTLISKTSDRIHRYRISE